MYIGEDLTVFVFFTLDFVAAVGYTPPPLDVLAGGTVDGELTGVRVHAHHETISAAAYIMAREPAAVLLNAFPDTTATVTLPNGKLDELNA